MSASGKELGEGLLTIWFLAFLALVWITVVMPGAVRARRRTPLPSSKSFKRAMRTIAPPRTGRWIVAPPTPQQVERRRRKRSLSVRRKVLAALIVIATASAVPAIAMGGTWVEIHLFLDGVVVAYMALLIELKRRSMERAAKVRPLPTYPEVPSGLRAVGDRSS